MSAHPTWEPVRRTQTHKQVLQQVEEQILMGRLKVGQRLPSERDLVTALGVSRTSVREALRGLEAMGIIEAKVGSGSDAGWTVAGKSPEALGTLLRLHVALAEIPLADLVEVRVQLERQAAENAARRRSDTDLQELRALVDAMRDPGLTRTEFNELDTEFHVRIAAASSNTLTADLMQALRHAVKQWMIAAFERISDWRSVADRLVLEHAAVVDAIETRDGQRAGETVARHITEFYENALNDMD